MANTNNARWFPQGLAKIMTKQVDLSGDTIKCVILDESLYSVNFTTHAALSDIPSGARKGTVTLSGLAVTPDANGCAFLATGPLDFGVIGAGNALNAIAYYLDSGVESTSWLLLYQSGNYAVGFPKTPDGVAGIKVYIRNDGIARLGG